ncbi:hypothetical protein J7337_009372 [Fusarium musae]|uniref:Glycosyltransferase family 17 n=1 Tax=Fusarium musae TaxID=1042133 RepID=A0A9P8DAV9_9HYPO|nr:hypothetical protein J7337_009372 [Fusarium musae]KAG9498564.1 hypothetical protein J7337_009372 [Fusarium musae]
MVPKALSRGILVIGICSLLWWALRTLHGSYAVFAESLQSIDLLSPTLDHDWKTSELYASKATHDLCSAHGYSAFVPKSPSRERKIYDMLMINDELDFLEIRLDALYDYVDYFIIAESAKTFQANSKPLILKDNWDRFRRYHDKVMYHELTFPFSFDPHRPWDYEDLQRDAPFDQVMLHLDGPRAPNKGDVLVVADVDEIPRPQTLLILRYCNFPRRLTLSSKFYYYSFQFLHAGPEWQHTQATYYQGHQTLKPTNLRNGDGGFRPLRFLERGVSISQQDDELFSSVDES